MLSTPIGGGFDMSSETCVTKGPGALSAQESARQAMFSAASRVLQHHAAKLDAMPARLNSEQSASHAGKPQAAVERHSH
jgi:hypothetical protein